MVSILLAIACVFIFSRGGIPELSKWFNGAWERQLTVQQLLEHIIMLGDFKSYNFNSVIWSLVHEMRISILFPLLMYVVVRINWKKSVAISLGCSIVYFLVWLTSNNLFNYNISRFDTSYILTIHYIGFFILGAVLAKHRQQIQDFYESLSKSIKIVLLFTGILAYTYSFWFLPNTFYVHFAFINDWAIAFGSTLFIISSLGSKSISNVLLVKPIHFMGKISFSLYLFHMTVIFSMINLFYDKLSIGVILFVSFILSFVVAAIGYYAIEKPSIMLGKLLTNKKIKRHEKKNLKAQQTF